MSEREGEWGGDETKLKLTSSRSSCRFSSDPSPSLSSSSPLLVLVCLSLSKLPGLLLRAPPDLLLEEDALDEEASPSSPPGSLLLASPVELM